MEFSGGRRFNSYVGYFRNKYGSRLQKVVVDGGFTCPNRDGTLSTGGCTFCDNSAFHPSYTSSYKSLYSQIDEGIEFHQKRYRTAQKYLAYFQPYSNSYAAVERLRELYYEALSHPLIVGVVIGTRPDCMDDKKIELLQEIAKEKIVIVEYGVESIYDRTLERINRGDTFATAKEIIAKTAKAGIDQGGHFIFGLPGESRREMLEYAYEINKLPLNSLKFHQLQIIKGSAMEREFLERREQFIEWSVEEYIDFFIDFLELLAPHFYIERFAGEVPPRFTNYHPWGAIRNVELIRKLERRLEQRETYQSRLYNQ